MYTYSKYWLWLACFLLLSDDVLFALELLLVVLPLDPLLLFVLLLPPPDVLDDALAVLLRLPPPFSGQVIDHDPIA